MTSCVECWTYTAVCAYCTSSLSEENGSEAGDTLHLEDKLEIVSECWVEPVSGTVTNCSSQQSHIVDNVYSRIADAVSCSSFFLLFLNLLT